MHPDHAIAHLSARQGGFVRRDQAIELGLTRNQIGQRLKDGRWKRVGRYGYRLFDMSDSVDRLRAAVAALPDAVVSHESAAELHGIPRVPSGRAVVSTHSQTTHLFPGVVVRRTHDLDVVDVVLVSELPTTTPSRTIVDLAAVVSPRHLESIVDESVAAGLVVVEDLVAVRDRITRRGKPGMKAIGRVLDRRASGPPSGTGLERSGAALLVDAGLPEPQYEYPIPWEEGHRFDAAYRDHRLAIEWDSIRWHTQLDAFQRDRERDRAAQLHGWRVLRFTWFDVKERPDHVIATVRTALAANRGLVN
jgi:Transcriptional regulator, AbiEi antitoxin/Protein of unknown function (DUF559)